MEPKNHPKRVINAPALDSLWTEQLSPLLAGAWNE